MKWGELFDTLGIIACAGEGIVCGLCHAPWYAFLCPVSGLVLFGLRVLARSL